MPRLSITLRQHTPIMHFQHDQEGATLRGTELKPRLDAFLIEHAFGRRVENYKKYIVGYTPQNMPTIRALDYRVKIVSKNHEPIELVNNSGTPYFVMDDGYGKHKAMISCAEGQEIELQILTRHNGLKEIIRGWICSFFMMTNFGFRKRKGFGSYTVKAIDGDESIVQILNNKEYKMDNYPIWLAQALHNQINWNIQDVCRIPDSYDDWLDAMQRVKRAYSNVKREIRNKYGSATMRAFVQAVWIKPVFISEKEKNCHIYFLFDRRLLDEDVRAYIKKNWGNIVSE